METFAKVMIADLCDTMPGNKAVLLALVQGMTPYRHSVAELAEMLHVSRWSIGKWLAELEAEGRIKVTYEASKKIVINCVKNQQSIVRNSNNQLLENPTINCEKNQQSTLLNIDLYIDREKDVFFAPSEGGKSEYETMLSVMASHAAKLGRVWVPHNATASTDARQLREKLRAVASEGETLEETFSEWLREAWRTGDQFVRDHFDLPYLNKHFNEITNNGTKRKTDHCGVDDEPVEEIDDTERIVMPGEDW